MPRKQAALHTKSNCAKSNCGGILTFREKGELTRRFTTMELCSMFRLEDKENFLILRSFAASIAALLCGGDGSLLTHERPVSKLTRLQQRPLSWKTGAPKGRCTLYRLQARTHVPRDICARCSHSLLQRRALLQGKRCCVSH